ncbi:MAG TPA: PA14 domain-containing protein [Polyangiaceae bacterium]|nr:PA14 domain-containing protein [Polyangiaceae bacterium]
MSAARSAASLVSRAFAAFVAVLACVAAIACNSGPPPGGAEPSAIGQVTSALNANGTACTASSQCTSGYCCGGTAVCTACSSDTNCASNQYCSSGVCVAKGAVNAACSAANQCLSAKCTSSKCANCGTNASCDDGIACTTDTCSGTACAHANVANGTACGLGVCENGTACTAGCGTSGGTCTPFASETAASCGAGVVCASCDDGNACTTDACSTTTGACSHTNVSNGTACTGGVCESGACCTGCVNGTTCVALGSESATQCGAAGAACGTCNDNNACTTDTCSATGVCQHANVSNGTTCTGGLCESGACCTGCVNGTTCVALGSESATQCGAGAAACGTCDDGNPCTTDTCSATGACQHTNVSNGTACTGGVCESGACCTGCVNGTTCVALGSESATQCGAAGAACGTCNDNNACTTDTCNAAGACQHTNVSNGTTCTGGRCEAGACCTSGCGIDGSGTCTAFASETATSCGAAGAVCASCNDSNICTTDTCSATGACTNTIPSTCANGLTGNYYNFNAGTYPPTTSPSGSANYTNVDSTVNFNWGNGSPNAAINTDYFYVVWTGQVLADTTGTYTFSTTSDDGSMVTVNGTQVVYNWYDQGATTRSGTINLTAGTRYDIIVTYYEHTGGASMVLSWTPPSGTSATIPADHLFAASGTCSPCDDGNPCTTDTCGANACTHANVVAGTACTGGVCTGGACCTGCMNGTTCVALGSETATRCGAGGGACGTCDDGNPCTVDACSAAGACTHTVAPAGTACRPVAGPCDVAESCNGTSTACPADTFLGSSTQCRASAGVCDVAESCTGSSAACPADGFLAINTSCPDDGNACTDDYCPGTAATCSHPTKASCSNGLTVTYYDNIDYTGPTVNRIDPNINFDWGTGSPDSTISNTTYSARWTGQVLADFSETYTFETEADDGVRLWVNNQLLVDDFVDQGSTKVSGTIQLTAGQRYDIKVDYFQDGGGADVYLRWSSPSTPYAVIPTNHLFAGGDAGLGGLAYNAGADNGTGDPYVVWQISSTPNTAPVNVSSTSPNNWGLGSSVMMVPAFSPDGTKLAFIDGDSAGGAGWRKGLSVFDFDEAGKQFSNRRSIRNTWSTGDVMKWPVWEPDSRSIIFQTSTPTELCTQCDGKTGYRYGNMAPTNYYGAPGTLWSIDSMNAGSAVQLAQLNTGERAADATKSYQPTMLPVSAGGYRWVVFTSTRPYGNVLNAPGISTSCMASQLWVAAIDDTTSASTDRSHPAFWLPNQNYGDPSQPNSINERGYWVLNPCKPPGTGAASACVTDDDCCNAPAQAACRIDQPATTPPTRHCVSINSNTCVSDGGSCGVDSDCCGFPSSHCITGVCTPPAPVPNYQNGVFTRDYTGDCPPDTAPVWRFFDWQTITPGDSKIDFSVQTSDTESGLASAPSVDIGEASGAPTTGWVGADVGLALSNANLTSLQYLRVTMKLDAASDGTTAPTLLDWRQAYSCIANQ